MERAVVQVQVMSLKLFYRAQLPRFTGRWAW